MKVLSVVGARPQFIKAFPVSAAIDGRYEDVLVHTGQHYDDELSDVFFRELDIPTPEYNLGVGSGTHAKQTAKMMERLDDVIEHEQPDWVLVYGDTNSTLAGALVATKRDCGLCHVEAGLRSGDWQMPEEINRVLTDHAADLLFVPSEDAVSTLEREGITDGVCNVGDVMYDAVCSVREVRSNPAAVVDALGADETYILATIHRPKNTDDRARLRTIVDGLASLSDPVVFPVHPRTKKALETYDLWKRVTDELVVTEPVGYLDFLGLVDGASRIVTDSGGIQKEAFYLDTPCVTIREETEWHETVECGWNVLVSPIPSEIHAAVTQFDEPASKPSLYGDGAAAAKIVETIHDRGPR